VNASESNENLVARIARSARGYVGGMERDPRVLDAMRAIDRAAFLPPSTRWAAYLDDPVPIGESQTCSQPSMVALMLDLLKIGPGLRMLEIGSGSGYAAAIASLLCAPGGVVYAAEIVPELSRAGRANCSAYRVPCRPAFSLLDAISFIEGDGSAGFPELAPFDRIMLSAGAASPSFRESILVSELSGEGILVYPQERGRLFRVSRTSSGVVRESWGGVAFVPLVGKNA